MPIFITITWAENNKPYLINIHKIVYVTVDKMNGKDVTVVVTSKYRFYVKESPSQILHLIGEAVRKI